MWQAEAIRRRAVLQAALAGALLSACGAPGWGGAPARPGEAASAAAASPAVLVKLRVGGGTSDLVRLARDNDLAADPGVCSTLERIGWRLLRRSRRLEPMADLVARLAADPAVAAAEANQPLNLVTRPIRLGLPAFGVGYNDPLAGRQWAVARIALAQAHAKTRSSSRTVVAVLDTGVDWSHPDFRAPDGRERVIRGRDWLKNTDFPRDGGGHGTHVAGIVGASADNALGTVGVAPDCTILAEKVTSDYGFGEAAGVAGAIIHATDAGARILTMSLGSPTLSQVVKDAVSYAQARDVLVVAAMGNSGRNEKLYPAALPGVMAVGATDDADRKASFSTFGDWISVAAPGTNILSTLPTFDNQTGFKDYGWMQGTSMATPHVAGLAALVRDLHPEMSAAATKKRIEQTALRPGGSGFSAELGFGRIDARRAVD